MADAFCGPSNALQNFSKHTTVDRTLQQDRTQHRSLPGQQFRSIPAGQFRNVDAEVNAFQASSAIPAFAPHLPSLNHELSSRRPFQSLQQTQPIPNWATDFQNMSLGDTYRPLPASQIRQVAPPRESSQGWRQDFASRASQIVPQSTSHYAQVSSYQGQNYAMQDYYPSMMEQPFYAQEPMHQPMAQQQEPAAPLEIFDDAAFASAFENASLELQQSTNKGKEVERQADNADEQISFDLSHASVEPPDHTGTFDMDSFMDNMQSISDIAASQPQEQEQEQEPQQPSSTLSNFVEAMKQIAEITQTQDTSSDEQAIQDDAVMDEDQDVFEDAQQDFSESSTSAPVINQQGQVNLDSFTKLMTDLAQLAETQGVENYEDIQMPPIVNSEGNVNLNSFTNLLSDLTSMAQQQGVENLEDLQLSTATGMVLDQLMAQDDSAFADLQRDLEAENASLDRVATPVSASRTTELPSWWNEFQIGDDLNEDYTIPPVQDPAPLATAEEVRQEEPKSEETQAQEANELAATAGELLERLRDEQDDKFLNSSFMSLMRQFRDHEVRVEGDKLVENPQPAHPGGQYYPHDAFVNPGTSNFVSASA